MTFAVRRGHNVQVASVPSRWLYLRLGLGWDAGFWVRVADEVKRRGVRKTDNVGVGRVIDDVTEGKVQ